MLWSLSFKFSYQNCVRLVCCFSIHAACPDHLTLRLMVLIVLESGTKYDSHYAVFLNLLIFYSAGICWCLLVINCFGASVLATWNLASHTLVWFHKHRLYFHSFRLTYIFMLYIVEICFQVGSLLTGVGSTLEQFWISYETGVFLYQKAVSRWQNC
jgi:hypothetical protein